MKKTILAAIVGLTMVAACKQSEKADNKETSNVLTRVDTIIYTSPKDVHKVDTLLLVVGIDTLLEAGVDTILVPSQDPPYDPVMHVVKKAVSRTGKLVKLNNQYEINFAELNARLKIKK